MARGGYEPEIKAAMGTGKPGRVNVSPRKPSPAGADSPKEVAADTKAGITQGSAADARMDAMEARSAPQAPKAPPAMQGIPADAHHVAAATSIAHAILNHRGGGAY